MNKALDIYMWTLVAIICLSFTGSLVTAYQNAQKTKAAKENAPAVVVPAF